MAMDSKTKVFSYRGGMYLLLTLLMVTLLSGFFVYRYSLLSHYKNINILDETFGQINLGLSHYPKASPV